MNRIKCITDLKDMLKKSGELFKDNIAFSIRNKNGDGYEEITHGEFREMVDALGTALIDLGLKGERIAVIGENRYEWELGYLASVCGTGIVVPIDKSLPQIELESVIKRSKVKAIIFSGKLRDKIEVIKNNGIGNLKYFICMDEGIVGEYLNLSKLIDKGRDLIKTGDKRFIDAKINPDEMSIMLFTSGTTAASKIVALSHKNLCSNLIDFSTCLELDYDDVFLSFLPIHHVFEGTGGFIYSLYLGARTAFADGPRTILQNIIEYKITFMVSVPAIYEMLYRMLIKKFEKEGMLPKFKGDLEKAKDLSMVDRAKLFDYVHKAFGGTIRILISGAAALDKEVEEAYRRMGFNLMQGYGLTETSPVITAGTNENYRLGSVGKTITNVEAKIVDADENGVGELITKGNNVMLGYLDDPKATSEVMKDGWFYTGDLARIDEDGFVYICGRKKNVIVLKNGKNIFPEELEPMINKIPGVIESMVFGNSKGDDKDDIKIWAKIVYSEEQMKMLHSLDDEGSVYNFLNEKIKEINSKLPRYKGIKGIIITTEGLIKTTTGKVRRWEELRRKGTEEILLKESDTSSAHFHSLK